VTLFSPYPITSTTVTLVTEEILSVKVWLHGWFGLFSYR